MKNHLFTRTWMMLLASFFAITSMAQVTTVQVNEAGTLWDTLESQGTDIATVTDLKVTGSIDNTDFRFMRSMLPALESIDLSGTDITEVPGDAFREVTHLRSCRLPETIVRISDAAFWHCDALENVAFGQTPFESGKIVFPASLTSMGGGAFEHCLQLTTVDFTACTDLGIEGFYQCTKLKEVLLPSTGSIRFGGNCFLETNIAELTLTGAVNWLEYNSLPYTLKKLIVESKTAYNCSANAFDSTNKSELQIWVPAGTLKRFSLADGWFNVNSLIHEYNVKVDITGNGAILDGITELSSGSVFLHNTQTTLTAQPADGYDLASATLDSTPLSVDGNIITLPTTPTEGTLHVTFAPKPYTLAFQVTGDGSILQGGVAVPSSIVLHHGEDATFTLQPADGLSVQSILWNGEESVIQNGGLTYKTPAITGDATLSVVFGDAASSDKVQLAIETAAGGSVQYKGITLDATSTILVKKNETAVLTIVPDAKKRLDKAMLNGTDVTAQVQNLNLLISGLTEDGQLSITFASGTSYVVYNPEGGALYDLIRGMGGNPRDVTHLTVNGKLDAADWNIIKNVMTSLEEADLSGTNITEVPEGAFPNRNTIKKVILPTTVKTIRTNAFFQSSIETIEGCDNVTQIEGGWGAFEGCAHLKSLPFGDKIEYLHSWHALAGCISLPETVVMPASLRQLGANALGGSSVRTLDLSQCSNLESLAHSCTGEITSLMLPEKGSFLLGGESLRGAKFTELVLPASVNRIDNNVMPSTLKRLFVQSAMPIDADPNAFSDVDVETCKLYVPYGSARDYQVAAGWAIFMNIQEYGFPLTIHGSGSVKCGDQTASNGKTIFPVPGQETSLQFMPATGYELSSVKLNGSVLTVGSDGTYTIDAAMLTGNIEVTYVPKGIEFALVIEGNGTVTIEDQTYRAGTRLNINGGKALQLAIAAADGNFVKQILLNEEEMLLLNGGTSFTTPVLSDNVQIKVVFANNSEAASMANITLAQTGYGTVSYRGVTLQPGDRVTINKGQNATLDFSYESDSHIESVLVNEEDITTQITGTSFTLENVSEDIALNVNFLSTTRLLVNNPNGGELGSLITAQGGNARNVKTLKVNGKMTSKDWNIVKTLMSNLEEIDLSGTEITEIPEFAFQEHSLLTSVVVPTTLKRIEHGAFHMCGKLQAIDGCGNVTAIAEGAFHGCTSLTHFPFGEHLEIIEGWNSFVDCKSLPRTLVFPTTFKNLGLNSFNGSSVKVFDLSHCENLEGAGSNGCYGQVEKLILPSTGSYGLGDELYGEGATIKELIIPSCVNHIYNNVFPPSMERMYVMASSPIPAEGAAFDRMNLDECILFVPAGSLTDYQLSAGWGKFSDIREAGFTFTCTGKGSVILDGKTYANNDLFLPTFGKATTFQVVPAPGYDIVSVKLNNQEISLTDDNSYTIDASILTGTLEVQFDSKDLAVTLEVEGAGSCTINEQSYTSATTIPVDGGTALQLTLTPNEGNFVKQILLNGEEMVLLNGGLSVTTPELAEDSHIKVVFANNSEASSVANISVESTGYGSVSYRGYTLNTGDWITISKGQNATFDFTIDGDSQLSSLLVNGEDATDQIVNKTFTIENIAEDISLEVEFFSMTHLVINNTNGGELNDLIVAQGSNARKVKVLKVNGKMLSQDWTVIKNLMSNLEEIDLSGTEITEIPEGAFNHKELLRHVILPTTVTMIQGNAFHMDGPTVLESIEGCENVQEIGGDAFANCVYLKTLPFGDKLTRIHGWNALYGCNSLPSNITMPATLLWLGASALNYSGIESVDLSACTALECIEHSSVGPAREVILPETGSFRLGGESLRFTQLTDLILPASINRIDNNVMPSTLERLYVKSATPIDCDPSAFDDVHFDNCVLYVPTGSSADYQMAPGWEKFLNVEEYGLRVKVGSEGKVKVGSQTIILDGSLFLKADETTTFQILPQDGWHVSEVKLNNTPVSFENNQIVLNAAQANGTLVVSFAINTFDFTIQTIGEGQIFLGENEITNGQVLAVDSASVMTFTLQPAAGKVVAQIKLNGEETLVQNGGTTYVTPNISRNSALQVTFAETGAQGDFVAYTVKTGDNGTVEYKNTTLLPETSIQVPKGQDAVFTLKPSPTYIVQSVTLNGEDVTSQVVDNVLTIENVNAAVQLEVNFQVLAEITLEMEREGLLSMMFSEESRQKVTKLTISGPLNWDDFYFMRDQMPQLSVLDLSNATCTEIPDRAFNISEEWDNETGKSTLTRVRLPEGIHRIGYRAFAGCTNLTEVNFEELTELNDIAGWAFARTGLRRANLGNTLITDLGDCQFRRASKLEYVALPTTLTNINNAFQENSVLTEIDLSNCTNLTNIGDAFCNDRKLQRVVLPEGLKTLNSTFSDCTALTSVNFPKTLEVIGDNTFVNTKITSADLKPCTKLQRIGGWAFNSCRQLANVTFPTSLQRIYGGAFHECDALTVVDMSQLTLTEIEGSLFCWCDNLESVKLPKTLVTIRDNAFRGTKLSGILELPASLTTIEHDAFSGTQITIIKIDATTPPALATENEDGENVFSNTVAAAFVPEGRANVYKEAPVWEDLTILDKEVVADVTVTREGNLAIDIMEQTGVAPGLITHLKVHGRLNATDFAVMRSNMTLMYDLDMEDADVSVIPENAFLEKKILMNVKLPSRLLVIQENAFKGCSALSGTLTLPSGVTTIGWAAFQGCTALNGIVFSDALEVIRGYAFEGCSNLTQELTFPDNFTSLGYYAFANCRNLFGTVKFNREFYMFMGSEGYWSETGRAFENCSGIEEVDLSECEFLTEIPSATFNECHSLTTVKLPTYIERIDDWAFNNCRSLTNINYPKSLLVINQYAFSGCSSLRRIDLSSCKDFGTIEGWAFSGCSSLETVNLPKSLNLIRGYAFNECRKLANLNVEALRPADLPEDYVFRRVNTEKCVLSIPTGTYYDYQTAAQWGAFVQMRNAIDVTLDEGAILSYVSNANVTDEESSSVQHVKARRAPRLAPAQQEGEAVVKDGTSLYVKDDESVTFFIEPEENVSIKQVLFNGEDVTSELRGNAYVTPNVTDAASFKVLLNVDGDITVKELRMTETDLAIKVAESHQLVATVYPNNATNKNVIWTSSDETVAKVLADGTITGLKAGRTTITARSEDGDFTQTCEVTIMSNDYYVTLTDAETFVQNEVRVPLALHNTDAASGIQFDVYLSEGLSLDPNRVEISGRSNGHSISAANRSDGSVRVIIYSNDGNAFGDNDGELVILPVTTLEATGDFEVNVKNVHVSGPNSFDFLAPDYTAHLQVSDYPLGDSNGNGEVTVTDVANTVDQLLERAPERFVQKAADVNKDGIISVSDITATIDIILGRPAAPNPAPRRRVKGNQTSDMFVISDFAIAAGGQAMMEMNLENTSGYTAFQCDVVLPEGVHIARDAEGHMQVALAGCKTASHVVSAESINETTVRIIAYSMQNTAFKETEGSVLNIVLEADEQAPYGDVEISVQDVRLVKASDRKEYAAPSTSALLTITKVDDINSLAGNDLQIRVDGRQVTIFAAEPTTAYMTAIDGKARLLRLEAGENRFNVEAAGVYVICGKKYIIK